MVISPEYRALLQELHDREDTFAGGRHVLTVAQIMRALSIGSLSDYGAGKMRLGSALRDEFQLDFEYFAYDPAFPEYGKPRSADLVCCIEVLEHVESELIDTVLEELAAITNKWGFFTIHCADSGKVLADGRNAHLLQQPISWWLTKLSRFFDVQWLNKTGRDSFAVLVNRTENQELRLCEIELYQRDSIKSHIAFCLTALQLEVRRRILRRKWRPH